MKQEDMMDRVCAVSFTYWVHMSFGESISLKVERSQDRYSVSCRALKREISAAEWNGLIHALFCDLHVCDWEESYEPRDVVVLDGYTWTLSIAFSDGEPLEYRGNNAHPLCWAKLIGLFEPYLTEAGIDSSGCMER